MNLQKLTKLERLYRFKKRKQATELDLYLLQQKNNQKKCFKFWSFCQQHSYLFTLPITDRWRRIMRVLDDDSVQKLIYLSYLYFNNGLLVGFSLSLPYLVHVSFHDKKLIWQDTNSQTSVFYKPKPDNDTFTCSLDNEMNTIQWSPLIKQPSFWPDNAYRNTDIQDLSYKMYTTQAWLSLASYFSILFKFIKAPIFDVALAEKYGTRKYVLILNYLLVIAILSRAAFWIELWIQNINRYFNHLFIYLAIVNLFAGGIDISSDGWALLYLGRNKHHVFLPQLLSNLVGGFLTGPLTTFLHESEYLSVKWAFLAVASWFVLSTIVIVLTQVPDSPIHVCPQHGKNSLNKKPSTPALLKTRNSVINRKFWDNIFKRNKPKSETEPNVCGSPANDTDDLMNSRVNRSVTKRAALVGRTQDVRPKRSLKRNITVAGSTTDDGYQSVEDQHGGIRRSKSQNRNFQPELGQNSRVSTLYRSASHKRPTITLTPDSISTRNMGKSSKSISRPRSPITGSDTRGIVGLGMKSPIFHEVSRVTSVKSNHYRKSQSFASGINVPSETHEEAGSFTFSNSARNSLKRRANKKSDAQRDRNSDATTHEVFDTGNSQSLEEAYKSFSSRRKSKRKSSSVSRKFSKIKNDSLEYIGFSALYDRVSMLLSSSSNSHFRQIIYAMHIPFGLVEVVTKLKLIDLGVCKRYIALIETFQFLLCCAAPLILTAITFTPVKLLRKCFIFKLIAQIFLTLGLFLIVNYKSDGHEEHFTVATAITYVAVPYLIYSLFNFLGQVATISIACSLVQPVSNGTHMTVLLCLNELMIKLNVSISLYLVGKFDQDILTLTYLDGFFSCYGWWS